MNDLRALEFESLRAAIRARVTLAPALLAFVVLGWATLTLWVFTTDVVSAATLVPLMVLAAGFEAILMLHTSATRLARFIQVAYEESVTSPELDARVLFPVLFGLATAVNFVPAAVTGTIDELAGIGVAHVLFVIRIIVADRRLERVSGSATKSAPPA